MKKEPPYDELIDVLRNDWQIEASWDGLRRVWYVGWTDEHVESCAECAKGLGAYADSLCDPLKAENAKLKELVRILYYCGLPWKDCDKCAMNGAEMHVKISDVEFCDGMYDRMRELGVEVDE